MVAKTDRKESDVTNPAKFNENRLAHCIDVRFKRK